MKHQDVGLGYIHIPYTWLYANSAARLAGSFDTNDAGKFARQADDNSIWMLISATGGWIQIGGGSAGVTSIAATGSTPLVNDVLLSAGYGMALQQSGQMITLTATGTIYPLFDGSPADVSATSASGTSSLIARGDHAHKGVSSIHITGASLLFGGIELRGASGISLSQEGNTIYIFLG